MEKQLQTRIIEALEEYMELHQMSAADVAGKSGVGQSYLSAMRRGADSVDAGDGKTVKIADKYFKKLAEYIGLELEKTYWDTVPTAQLKRIMITLEDARMYGYTNVIIGETGCGKTYAATLYQQSNPVDTFVIKVGQSDNIGDLIDKIIEKIGLKNTGGSKSRRIDAIVSRLKKMNLDGLSPLLIFDEAEYMKQAALCAMKEFYDNLRGVCGIVLIGTDQLTRNLDKLRKKNKDGIPQFFRRIKFGIRMLPTIDRSFKQFTGSITDKNLVRFIQEHCDNYGELYDVLVPALREADRTGAAMDENFVRTILHMPRNN